MDRHPIDAWSIKVGEASCSVDPLSSQGVQIAITSGLQGGIAAHTLLNFPENAAAAIEFYRHRQEETSMEHYRWAGRYYAEQCRFKTAFWNVRSIGDSEAPPVRAFQDKQQGFASDRRVRISGDAKLVAVPSIEGNIIKTVYALSHPGLDRPVAFIKNIPVKRLWDAIEPGKTIRETTEVWTRIASPGVSWEIARWMYDSGLLLNLDSGLSC
ncbi:MAG: tryptophan 7-halogenase [Acidobacteriota bacterium]|nr:tryptophan 7-halogenase [Acidobacteriota bacterium]